MWSCVLKRSSVVPRNYEQKEYWLSVLELLATLKEELEAQDLLSKELAEEHIG